MAKIGLEIHAYLNTKEKLFCSCLATRHKEQVNNHICPICTGQPGCKPMLPNEEAIKKILSIALMLNCEINNNLIWQRKHYNWPDLPKGYQTTMSGAHSIPTGEEGNFHGIKIKEIHLEEDPASWDPETGCIDYNRSGLPLAEIVTQPDFSSAEEVEEWLKKFLLTMSYIKAIDKNAGIKADVNISTGSFEYGKKVEVKNISSIESVKKTIEYEIKRQEKEGVLNETRRFNPSSGKTEKMRNKESQADYRFIPDPDLPIVKIKKEEVEKIKKELPETPEEKLSKLIKKHKIDKKQAEILKNNFELVEFFEEIIKKMPADFALPWVTGELLRVLNYNKKNLGEVNIEVEHFIELLEAVKSNKLTELKAKSILNDFVPKSFSIKSQLKSNERITDKAELTKIIEKVIKVNSKAVSDYKAGEKASFNFLMGEVMKESNRRADFQVAKEVLEKLLK
jgi:aspartyl-tRNA(Asn)/glutamyl-tRNA(Gln) amidotransferase subunit B